MIKIMVSLGGDQEITKEKTKPKEEEASGSICKNTEDSTPIGLELQDDKKTPEG